MPAAVDNSEPSRHAALDLEQIDGKAINGISRSPPILAHLRFPLACSVAASRGAVDLFIISFGDDLSTVLTIGMSFCCTLSFAVVGTDHPLATKQSIAAMPNLREILMCDSPGEKTTLARKN
jgi:hypothetical protein